MNTTKEKKEMILIVNTDRWNETQNAKNSNRQDPWHTGIYVRAKTPAGWASVDIAILEPESLLVWLRSRGGYNPWAENTVGLLLNYAYIVPDDEQKEI